MGSISKDLESLNLGAEQPLTSQCSEAAKPDAKGTDTTLGAIPKRRTPKKSGSKSVTEPLSDANQAQEKEQPSDPLRGKKTQSSQRRMRRGKRAFRQAEEEAKIEADKKDDAQADEDKENSIADNEADLYDDDDQMNFPPNPSSYPWRNITRNGWIKKCILVDGKEDSDRPKPGDVVLVKTKGKLKDGKIVDDHRASVFNVGEYEIIEGLDLAVQTMRKNELAIVSIKPELAYGSLGRFRTPTGKIEEIPANQRITYLVGLLHFEKSRDSNTLTWAQRRKCGQARMRLANWWLQRKDYSIAIKVYKKALTFYNEVPANTVCSSPAEAKELMLLLEERLRVMRQVANIFRRIANLIQGGQIDI